MMHRRFEVFTAVTVKNPVCWMWCNVVLLRTDVSEERIASIIRVTRISELGTTLAVTCKRRQVDFVIYDFSASLGVRHVLVTSDHFFLLLKTFYEQLWLFLVWGPSLTRGQVDTLQLLLGLTIAVLLGSVSTRLMWVFRSCSFEMLQTWRVRFLYLFLPRIV
jgi:hypothetical protein